METVYILQIITICITAITLVINVLVTLFTNKQKNYNEIITSSRLEFMMRNRDNAAKFIAEAKSVALSVKCGNKIADVKPLYASYEQLRIAMKTYNEIDRSIVDAGGRVVALIEQAVVETKVSDELTAAIDEFSKMFNVYDDADWKFIKQQFNTTNKNSADFDKLCDEIMAKYTEIKQ